MKEIGIYNIAYRDDSGFTIDVCDKNIVSEIKVPSDLVIGNIDKVLECSPFDYNRNAHLIVFWNVDGVFYHPSIFWNKECRFDFNRIINTYESNWVAEKVDTL